MDTILLDIHTAIRIAAVAAVRVRAVAGCHDHTRDSCLRTDGLQDLPFADITYRRERYPQVDDDGRRFVTSGSSIRLQDMTARSGILPVSPYSLSTITRIPRSGYKHATSRAGRLVLRVVTGSS